MVRLELQSEQQSYDLCKRTRQIYYGRRVRRLRDEEMSPDETSGMLSDAQK